MTQKKSRVHFVDRLDLRITIPEDERHPISNSILPHHCELQMYKLSPHNDTEFEYTLSNHFNARNEDEKKTFLMRIAMWLGVSLLNGSVGKDLKFKYCKEMVDHMQEVQNVYKEIDLMAKELSVAPMEVVSRMKEVLAPKSKEEKGA